MRFLPLLGCHHVFVITAPLVNRCTRNDAARHDPAPASKAANGAAALRDDRKDAADAAAPAEQTVKLKRDSVGTFASVQGPSQQAAQSETDDARAVSELGHDLHDGSPVQTSARSGAQSSLTLTEDGSVDESAWEPFSEWASGELLGCTVRTSCPRSTRKVSLYRQHLRVRQPVLVAHSPVRQCVVILTTSPGNSNATGSSLLIPYRCQPTVCEC